MSNALRAKSAFITLKDHKPNFANNPTCRLINPSKSEIGIVSKKILQRVNAKIVSATHLNQWKNTDSVLTLFNKIPNKPSYSFITFDIIDFYPSISEDLLVEALTFATKFDIYIYIYIYKIYIYINIYKYSAIRGLNTLYIYIYIYNLLWAL